MKIKASIDIPAEYQEDFANGTLKIGKAVVRNSESGKVASQFEISPEYDDDDSSIDLKDIALGGAIAVGVLGIKKLIGWFKRKKLEKIIEDFNDAFNKYVDEMSSGSISKETIEKLLSEVNTIEEYENDSVLEIFSTEQIRTLILYIYDFTKEMAEKEGINTDQIENPSEEGLNNVISLRECLEMQKELASKAA